MENNPSPIAIQKKIWDGRIPLEITLAPSESRTFDKTDPYLVRLGTSSPSEKEHSLIFPDQIAYHRVSYLPTLLPRLRAFFSTSLIEPRSQHHDGWFSFEGVPLKWHYPIGLLFDLYAGAEPATRSSTPSPDSPEDESPLPWRLTVHFSDWPVEDLVRLDANGIVLNDAFINSVKEADFLRNGTAKGIMTLSKEDSSGLWKAVENVDLPSFQRISSILLPSASQPFRNVPIRVFLPLPPDEDSPSLKVVQSPFPPSFQTSCMQASQMISSRSSPATQAQTIGNVLHTLLPNLFPSRRTPVLAKPVLHGAVLPMSAPIEEIVRTSAYGDGWVYLVVRMMG
ncbi:Autophagy-related protein 5 [Penicillium malachiteum]|nr:Autophagy-related protein 5 [Penicillium malachiteum]